MRRCYVSDERVESAKKPLLRAFEETREKVTQARGINWVPSLAGFG